MGKPSNVLLPHCIFLNLVNIMLLIAELQSPLLEKSAFNGFWISMFFLMSYFRGRLVESFISLSTWQTHVVFCLPGGFWTGSMKALSVFWAGVCALDGKNMSISCFVPWHYMASFQFVHIGLYWRSPLVVCHWWFFLAASFETRPCCFPGFPSVAPRCTWRYFGYMLQILLSWPFHWNTYCLK